MTGATGSMRVKSAYVGAMRLLRRAVGDRLEAEREIPYDQRARHYARSLLAIYDVEALVALGVPWWSYRATDVVEAWLAGRGGQVRAFEYGAGASTIWLAARCAEVISVEHDTEFADVLRPMVADQVNVDLRVRPPVPAGSRATVRSERAGYEGMDFSDYVQEINAVGGAFDLIVVDGRARNDALAAALPHLAAGGIVVFDNANRARYQGAIRSCGLPARRYRGLTPAVPYPTTTAVLGPREGQTS